MRVSCFLEERRYIHPLFAHDLLRLLCCASNGWEDYAVSGNNHLPFFRAQELHPFPSFFFVLAADPDRVCQTVKHGFASTRTFWQRGETLVEFCVVDIP